MLFAESLIEEVASERSNGLEMFGGRSAHLAVPSAVESGTNQVKMAGETLKYQGKSRIAQRISPKWRDIPPKDTGFLASRQKSRQSVATRDNSSFREQLVSVARQSPTFLRKGTLSDRMPTETMMMFL